MYNIDNLLACYDEDFIDNVYRYTLEREADAEGKTHFLEMLRAGTLSKKDILFSLQNSEEGKKIRPIPKIKKIQNKLHKIHKLPFIGYITQSISTLVSLPKLISQLEKTQRDLGILKTQNTAKIDDLFSILSSSVNYGELITARDTLNQFILSHTQALENKKVLICCNAYPPHFIGGAEIIAHYQALELQKQGYTVKVFAGDLPLETEHYTMVKEHYEGIEIFRVKLEESDFAGNTINFLHKEVEKHFQHILDTFQPSIVHMHNIIGLSVALGSIAKKSAIKTVMTLHDGWGFCYKNTMMRNDGQFCHDFTECNTCIPFVHKDVFGNIPIHMRQDYFTLALRDIDLFISPSQYLKDQYIKAHFKEDKINVLTNGIDIDKFNTTPIKSNKISFTFIGYLGEHKGIVLLLEALTLLKDKSNITLKIIGEGVLKDELIDNIKENNLTSCVEMLGKLPNSKIPEVFAQTDVYILPSQWPENQPVTITEAFASRVPVIGTDFGGIKELVTHQKTGLLFPMGDAAALAKQMTYFIDNPSKIKEFGENAFEFIKDKSFHNQVKQLISHYNKPIAFEKKENLFTVACVGSHLSDESIEIMSHIKQEYKEIHFVLHEWLINPYDCNLVWFTDDILSIALLEKYKYLQKPYLVNATEELISNYVSKDKNTFTYTNQKDAIQHIVKRYDMDD